MKPAARVLDRVAHQQVLGRLLLRLGRRAERHRHRPGRLPPGQRPLDQLPHRMVGRQLRQRRLRPRASRAPSGSSARIAALEKISSPSGENSATASSRFSMTDSNSVAVDAAGSALVRTAASCALTASNEVPRSPNSSPRQIERDVELAASQPGQAALDDVDRPQHPLRQQHRDQRRDHQRDERGVARRVAAPSRSRCAPAASRRRCGSRRTALSPAEDLLAQLEAALLE